MDFTRCVRYTSDMPSEMDDREYVGWFDAVMADESRLMPDSVPTDELLDAEGDRVTKTENRGKLEKRLKRLCENHETDVGVLFIDITQFGQFNNTFGHDTGDAVLQNVVTVFRANVRGTVYRYGGDEFVILLDGVTSREGLNGIGARLAAAFDGHKGNSLIPSVSIGGFHLGESAPDEAREKCILAADTAMYAIKEQKRAEMRNRGDAGGKIIRDIREGKTQGKELRVPLSGYTEFLPGKNGFPELSDLHVLSQ